MNWKEKSTLDKAVSIIGMLCSIAIIVLAALQMTGVWDKAINVFEPLMGTVMLLQAFQYRKNQRTLAIFFLCVAIFIFAVAFIVFFVR